MGWACAIAFANGLTVLLKLTVTDFYLQAWEVRIAFLLIICIGRRALLHMLKSNEYNLAFHGWIVDISLCVISIQLFRKSVLVASLDVDVSCISASCCFGSRNSNASGSLPSTSILKLFKRDSTNVLPDDWGVILKLALLEQRISIDAKEDGFQVA